MPPATDTSDRVIILTRTFAAPCDLVFATWTDQRHIGQWWGPKGFRTTTAQMDVRPGGLWVYTMHGPDGTDYPNWIRYTVIDRPHRLEYDHGSELGTPTWFHTVVTFTAQGNLTRVTMTSVFPTAEARDAVVQRYGAIEGGKQHLSRLGEHLATLAAGIGEERVRRRFTRTFAAAPALVFQAWTDPAQLVHWWGPHDFTNPECVFEAKVGGRIHIAMRGSDGHVHPMAGEVCQIDPVERLVFVAWPMDDQGNRMFEVLNTVEFAAVDGGTRVTVTTDVQGITPAAKIPLEGMEIGWAQSLERLDDWFTDPDAACHPERDIVTVRVIPALRDKVYAAWTDPAVLARWWGPKGFTNEFAVCDLTPGGEWRFIMRGPDGIGYPNHSVFEILRAPELIVIKHLGSMHRFQIHASFFPLDGGTLLRFRMRFRDSGEAARIRAFVVPAHGEMFDRLEAVLAEG